MPSSKIPISDLYVLKCLQCGAQFLEKETVTTCLNCESALDAFYSIAISEDCNCADSYASNFDFLKSINRLPLLGEKFISLGEGNTPLLRARNLEKEFGLNHISLKYEGANPTGVFKDRGSAVEISKALEMGAKAICCASTGNMAASVAAYSAKAKIPCYVLIPEKTPMGKLSQALAYGANIIKIRGTYKDCVRISVEMSQKYGFYLAGDYVFRLEGGKSVAYEIWKQMEGKIPDWIVVPLGCGTHMSAIYKGFCELRECGLIKQVPRFIGTQPEKVPTIVEAWKQKKKTYIPTIYGKSIASALSIEEPLDDVKALRALYDSNGYAITASEEDILVSQQLLGREEALFVEPAAALPVAVLKTLKERGVIKPEEHVLLVITGTGLKDPESVLSGDLHSPVVEPKMTEIDRYFSSQLDTKISHMSSAKKREKLWQKVPDAKQMQNEVEKTFGIHLDDTSAENLTKMLRMFQEKEKTIRYGDLEYAVENILKMPENMKSVLHVDDFSVHVTQKRPAEAWVMLSFYDAPVASQAKGVGPVDAIINAMQDAMRIKDELQAKLCGYSVEINTGGTDAVVEVELSLQTPSGQEVTGEASSPDVIVASIRAFENAYNLLHWKSTQQ